MREQVVREQHRLRVLQVRAAGQDGGRMRVRLRRDRVDQRDELLGDGAGVVAQVQAHERGDLVVAAAAGAQLAAQLGAGALDQAALEGRVHVLVALDGRERAGCDVRVERVERGEHPVELVRRQVAGRGERRGVRARAGDVVRRELPVEMRRLAERRELRRRTAGEPAAPEGARLAGAVLGLIVVCRHGAPTRPARSRRAEILLGSDHSSMKPLASDWSNVSPVS